MKIITQLLSNTSSFITAILLIIGCYKVFEKAKIEGWKAIIPIYREYIIFTNLAKLPKKFFIGYVVSFVAMIILAFGGGFCIGLNTALDLGILNIIGFLMIIIMIPCMLVAQVLLAYAYYKVFKKFGKENAISILFAIFAFIGFLVVGFDNSVFMDEPVQTEIKKDNQLEPTIKYCSNCGQSVQGSFCSNCGSKIE